jgi:hypothetical protein
LQTAIAAVTAARDSYTDSAAAIAAIFAQASFVAGAQPQASVIAFAAVGDSDPDSANTVFAVAAQTSGSASAQPEASFAAVTAVRDSHTDSAAAIAAILAQAAGSAEVPIMMIPGSIDGNHNWVEASSLARAIEEAMTAAGVLHLDKESVSVKGDRRKGFVAVSSGLLDYIKQNMEIHITQGQLHSASDSSLAVPSAALTLTKVVK